MSAVTLEHKASQNDEVLNTSSPIEGVLAEFTSPDDLVNAADLVRTSGFTKTDAYSPFPVHGIDAALGIRSTRLPWFVLCVGLCGGSAALLMQWWMNAVDYPFLISGKPLFSLPANIPVTFEVIVLTSAFATFFGMLGRNCLPKLSNSLLEVEQFRNSTNNRFYHYVAADDPAFDRQAIVNLYQQAGALEVHDVFPSTSSAKLPPMFTNIAAVVLTLALVPVVGIIWARTTTSTAPRIDLFWNMDSQDRPGPQQASALFADGRAMRPQIPGTIAVGDFHTNDAYYLGYLQTVKSQTEELEAELSGAAALADPPPVDPAAAPVEPDYVSEFPFEVTEARMLRGQQKYNIYCSPCHGLVGQGDGLISLRAFSLQQPTWIPPTNLTNEVISAQPVGKLFDTITNGRRKMAGYAAQISPDDRWSIVLYLRALQRSQNASLSDVPQEQATILNNRK